MVLNLIVELAHLVKEVAFLLRGCRVLKSCLFVSSQELGPIA